MKIRELLQEAPLTDYVPLGDFEKPGPFRNTVDKKLVNHPKNQLKAEKFFSGSPYNFRLFFSNVSGTTGPYGAYKEYGPATPDIIEKLFKEDADRILSGSDNAITVIFLGNFGADRVMITPWIMAHRIGHSIQAGNRRNFNTWTPWKEAEQTFFGFINRMLTDVYGKRTANGRNPINGIDYDFSSQYNGLFNKIGTQRSSRTGQIKRPYEFLYELFAQYIKDGKITLSPFPRSIAYGRKAWGNPTNFMSAKQDWTSEELKDKAEELEQLMADAFNEVLASCVGKIYLM